MQSEAELISDRVRGVAAEKRFTHGRIASILGVVRSTISLRMNGSVPWTGAELLMLAAAMDVPIQRFFPDPKDLAPRDHIRGDLSLTG